METEREQNGGQYVRGLYKLALLYNNAAKTGIGDSRDLKKEEIEAGVHELAKKYAAPKK